MKDTGVNGNDDFIDLGYRFMQKHWGKGYATESAQAALDYGLNTLCFPLINAIARVENVSSVRVLTKIGMLRGDEDEVRAQPTELVGHVARHAVADGQQGDDRGHADEDAQHRQRRAQFVGRQAAEGDTNVLS